MEHAVTGEGETGLRREDMSYTAVIFPVHRWLLSTNTCG